MKPANRNLILILTSLFMMYPASLSGQQKEALTKIKNVTVYEEKLNKLISRKTRESETSYDSRGNIIEEILYVDDKIDKHTQYQYNATDNLIKEIDLDASGKTKKTIENKYDPSNNKIKEIELDASGKATKTSEYKYDKGLRIEKYIYGSDKKLRTKKTYVYTTY